jgi:hypothetical protein
VFQAVVCVLSAVLRAVFQAVVCVLSAVLRAVFQAVVCVLSAVLHGTHFTHHNTAKLITMYFY